MFKRVLIANRGEIAVRIAGACEKLGVEPVTVHSEADMDARHALMAESHIIGPPPVSKSYLNGSRIIEVAKSARCEAVHPGYGLLSESAEFAQQVISADLTWIGPSPEVIATMGTKTRARAFMELAGVPVIPGANRPTATVEDAQRFASDLGYPVMVKSVAGGGGIGMQRVADDVELHQAFKRCASQAKAYFGNGDLYIEKALLGARHIEIQILSDQFGTAIHLGERECSVQRRNQKVVEEAGSPVVTPELRDEMGRLTVQAIQKLGYTNAGTVEFLLDSDGRYWFLEMNTRLQVEHPVTELTTEVDLVCAQIAIAAAEPLPWRQRDIRLVGHAIEARVYAEDPDTGIPAPGTIEHISWPQDIRIDTFIEDGTVVSPHYDPLLAKIIVHCENRRNAVYALQDALDRATIRGIKTNLPLLRRIVAHRDFRSGHYDTGFINALTPPGDQIATG